MSSLHADLNGANLHVPGYRQDSDPGAVGAGVYWVDSSGGTGFWTLKVRNAANSGWEEIASGGGGGGGSTIHADAYASPPGAPADGDVWLVTDGRALYRYNGSAWIPWGPLYPYTEPAASGSWTQLNFSGASVTDSQDALYLTVPANASANIRGLYVAAPALPYTITAAIMGFNHPVAQNSFGLFHRQSSDGKLAYFNIFASASGVSTAALGNYTSATSFSAQPAAVGLAGFASPFFLRMADDNTNRIYSVSHDGVNWTVVYTVARTTFLTADQVGWGADSSNGSWNVSATLVSWKVA